MSDKVIERLANIPIWVLEVVIYSTLGIIIMLVSFLLAEKFTKVSLHKEIIEDENICLWIIFWWAFVATGIIIAAAIW